MGTNALPLLLGKLAGGTESPLKRRVRFYASKWRGTRWLFPDPVLEKAQAVTGLLALCPLPPDAVLQLSELTADVRNPLWSKADFVLRGNVDPRVATNALAVYK